MSQYSLCSDSIKYGYGKNLVNPINLAIFNHALEGEFRVLTRIVECNKTPLQYAIDAAKKVYAHVNFQKIYLALSSGVDSQAMLQSFLSAKIPIQPVVFCFSNNENTFDTEFILNHCQSLGLKPLQISVDLDSLFFKKKLYLDYHKKYRIHIPGIAAHLWAADQINNPLIFSGNPPSISITNETPSIDMPSDAFFSYERYFEKNKKYGTGNFFLTTPQLIHSFIQMPTFQSYLKNSTLHYSYETKVKIYTEAGFTIVPQNKKFHGFEIYNKMCRSRYNDDFHAITFKELKKTDPYALDEGIHYDSEAQINTRLEYLP